MPMRLHATAKEEKNETDACVTMTQNGETDDFHRVVSVTGVAGGIVLSTDQPNDGGTDDVSKPDKDVVKRRKQRDNQDHEPARRRNRRAQRKDQQNHWRKIPGGCWPSPPPDDSKTK
jgi:hypothetical protein